MPQQTITLFCLSEVDNNSEIFMLFPVNSGHMEIIVLFCYCGGKILNAFKVFKKVNAYLLVFKTQLSFPNA